MFSSSTVDETPKDYIDMVATVGKLMIVRPLEYRQDFITIHAPQGTDVVFCDIAVVDDVDPATGQQGRVYRGQAVLQGFLKGTFKRKIGDMVVGMLYMGLPTKGKKPFMWHDLFGDPGAVARATAWVTANQGFLVPLVSSTPEPAVPAGPPVYVPPASGGIVAPTPAVAGAGVKPPGTTTLEQMRNFNFAQGQQGDDIPF